jgi:hypothetical protein
MAFFSDSRSLVDRSLNGMPKVEKEKVTKRGINMKRDNHTQKIFSIEEILAVI